MQMIQAIDKIQSTFPEWDSEKCPTARYYGNKTCGFIQYENIFLFDHRHVLTQMRQRTVKPEVENDKNTRNESNKIKQSSLLGYALMASALITLVS